MEIKAIRYGRIAKLTSSYPKELLEKLTSYTVPGVWYMPAFHRRHLVRRKINGQWRIVQERVWDGKTHLLRDGCLPVGVLSGLGPILAKEKYTVALDDEGYRRWCRNKYSVAEDPQSRSYQEEAVRAMLNNLHLGGLVLCATGTGKTHLAGRFFRSVPGIQHLFIVDELTLLHQAREELGQAADEKVGLIGESRFEPQRITVATIQTLWNHYKEDSGAFAGWLLGVEVVVIDEVHVQMNRRNFSVVEKLQPKAIFGLTATLELKKKDVRLRSYSLCGPVIYEYPLQEGISQGYLSPLNVILVQYPNQDLGTKYLLAYQESIVDNPDRNHFAATLASEALRQGHRVIILVDRVRHVRIMADLLKDFTPKVIWGGVVSEERIAAKAEFEEGSSKLLVTNRVFEKGIDIRTVTVGIDLAAMKSKVKAIQKLGRLARRAEGKKYALYFDIQDEGVDGFGKAGRFMKAASSRARAYRRSGLHPFLVKVRAAEDAPAMFQAVVRRVEGQGGGLFREIQESEL